MKDRRAPRGGARNESADLLAEALEELQETIPHRVTLVRGERVELDTADWLRACGLDLPEEES